ncbi:hypothetical protein Pla110_24430 [Polystyrenella longa]|uniref:Uncharacterized protein n=1 Tax=Polystyrenella longa TaxID=2528007 RepID=A0A518CNA1_9PLAN|nr:hypothetical protein [Polystyrenella longa]QDU80711.1 hypothetical protein Pla110_24430 [Polystyrenella longa]
MALCKNYSLGHNWGSTVTDRRKEGTDLWMWAYFLLAAVVVIFLWWIVGYYPIHKYGSTPDAGTYGDSFGFVNSLFSGLALAGVIVAIMLQRKDLQIQSETLAKSADEAEKLAELTKEQTAINRKMLEIETAKARPFIKAHIQFHTNRPEGKQAHLVIKPSAPIDIMFAYPDNLYDETKTFIGTLRIGPDESKRVAHILLPKLGTFKMTLEYVLQNGLLDKQTFLIDTDGRDVTNADLLTAQQVRFKELTGTAMTSLPTSSIMLESDATED